jgi:hypothetical protein
VTRLARSVTRSCIALLAVPIAMNAAEVTLELESPIAWPDTSVTLQVKISDPGRGMGSPQLSPVPGLEIRGPSRPSRQSFMVNGRGSEFYVYAFEVAAAGGRTGKFTIGPVTIPRQGLTALQSGTVELVVAKKPPPGIQFGCELQPATGPIGAPFKLIYTVYYSGEPAGGDDDFFSFQRQNPLGLTVLDFPVLQLSTIKLKPIRAIENADATKVGIKNSTEILLQRSFAEKNGLGYMTLVIAFEVTPFTTGPIEVGGANVAMSLKTGGTEVRRDVFGTPVRVAKVESFQEKCPDTEYNVLPLPEAGRPVGFTGAVGRFKVAVRASPTEVDAFAPITLEVRVTGQGLLETLKPPAWSEVESITRDFDVSTDVDSGKVEDGAKVFRQVIRPHGEKVTAIPAIPFPYFDPQAMKYQVALSESIPIKVRAVKTVGGDEAIPSPRATPDAVNPARQAPVSSIVERAGIGANFTEVGQPRPALDPRDEVLAPPFVATVAAPPCLLGLVALVLRLRRKDPASKRRSRALAKALAALSPGSDPSAVAQVCEGYFRDRLGLPPGELTPADLAAALERAGAPSTARIAATELLEQAHAARFGGGGDASGALQAHATGVLKEIEQCLHR